MNGNPVTGSPDLLLVLDGNLLDEPAVPTAGAYPGADSSMPLSGTNPAGTGDWTGWTLTSALIDGLPALYARDTTSGRLYYYSPADLKNLALGGSSTRCDSPRTAGPAARRPRSRRPTSTTTALLTCGASTPTALSPPTCSTAPP